MAKTNNRYLREIAESVAGTTSGGAHTNNRYLERIAGGMAAGSYTSTATTAGTTTLTSTSTYKQRFSGVTTQTVVLPVASTVYPGYSFFIINDSTGAITVNSSGGNLVTSVAAGDEATITNILASGTSAASWTVSSISAGAIQNTSLLLKGDGAGNAVGTTTPDIGTATGASLVVGTPTTPLAPLHINSATGVESSFILGQTGLNRWKFSIPANLSKLNIGDIDGDYVTILTAGKVGLLNPTPVALLHVGPNANVALSNDPGVLISRDISDATGPSATSAHGFVDEPAIFRTNGTGTGYASFDARPVYSGTSNYDHWLTLQSLPIYGSSGTLTNAYSLFHTFTINSGTVTNSYGARLNNAVGAGTVVNQYGLYIENQTKGTTLNYGIYSAGGLNFLSGGTGVGIEPTEKGALQIARNVVDDPAAGSTYAQLEVTGLTSPEKRLALGYNTFGNYGVIQAVTTGSSYDVLKINPSGGAVVIGGATTCTGATIGTGSKSGAGFVTATTTGASTVVVTFPTAAPTGWAIAPQNNTTANMIRQTASSTTTATFVGTMVTGDVISYVAMAY